MTKQELQKTVDRYTTGLFQTRHVSVDGHTVVQRGPTRFEVRFHRKDCDRYWSTEFDLSDELPKGAIESMLREMIFLAVEHVECPEED